jgi:hypothetical protein
MKTTWAAFVVAFGLVCYSQSALAEHTVELRGIVNVPGQQLAFLQIDREPWAMKAGEHYKGGTRAKSFPIEAIEVDVTNGVVKMRVDDEDYTNSLPMPARPETAKSWIHLQNADFEFVINLLGDLSRRTILLHPMVKQAPVSCEGTWTDSTPSEAELLACFAKPFGQRDAVILDDGDCFLQLIPTDVAQSAVLGAKDLPHLKSEVIQPGSINFRGVDISEVLDIYSKLINRQMKGPLPAVRRDIKIVSTCPLSKEQTTYAFETLLRWNGVQIVTNDDNTISALVAARQSK